MLGPCARLSVRHSRPYLDVGRWLILVSFEQESAQVAPFGVYATGELFFGFSVQKSVFEQFLTWSNLKKFHFFLVDITNSHKGNPKNNLLFLNLKYLVVIGWVKKSKF